MKESVSQPNTRAQSRPSSHGAAPKAKDAGASAGKFAQLTAMTSRSSQVQGQLKLAQCLHGNSRVEAQRGLAAEINRNAPAQLHGIAVNDDAGLARETDVMGENAPANDGHAAQLKQDVVQRVGFLPGQARRMVEWLQLHGLDALPVFQGIVNRFDHAGDLDDNDAEAITLLFLTKEAPYREFEHADLAIEFIFWDVGGYSIPRAVTTVGEFTNAYKTFFHLYRRAVNVGRPDPVADAYYGFVGLDNALGNVDHGAVTFSTNEAGSASDVHIAIIRNFAENNQLAFPSPESAISHLVKHGTLFNQNVKLTGYEPPQQLQAVYQLYIVRANHIVATGVPTEMDRTLGKKIFSFALGGERAIVSFDDATASAELTTYFPTEPLDVVNDEPVGAHALF